MVKGCRRIREWRTLTRASCYIVVVSARVWLTTIFIDPVALIQFRSEQTKRIDCAHTEQHCIHIQIDSIFSGRWVWVSIKRRTLLFRHSLACSYFLSYLLNSGNICHVWCLIEKPQTVPTFTSFIHASRQTHARDSRWWKMAIKKIDSYDVEKSLHRNEHEKIPEDHFRISIWKWQWWSSLCGRIRNSTSYFEGENGNKYRK